jgi:hypothetical protein
VDERVRRDFLVDDHGRARVAAAVPGVDRVGPWGPCSAS